MQNWTTKNNTLYQKFKFKNFIDAWAFMSKVALLAEKANHHPEWKNIYNTVEIWLTTHDESNTITEKDETLAKAIDGLG
ncbi:MAG: 4a-hydroxytetrahydrobiopterin dehydratase [Vicingaceae bacterium]|jgi:4a-hydroxytetrahydrobiopterin dehydratase